MIKIALVDLDGTVYEGNNVIPGAADAIEHMRACGIKVIFCTNNSSKNPSTIIEKLNRMGISCSEKEIITSIMMALRYVKEKGLNDIYLCGSEEVTDYFVKNGVQLCDEHSCENLIISMDTDYNYERMTRAVRAALRSRSIIVCNRDKLYPTETGVKPGCDAIVSSILAVTGREPSLVIGKPRTMMIECISNQYNAVPDEIVVIGDGIETDMGMAKKFGTHHILIGSDVESIADTISWDWKTRLSD